LYRAFYRIDIIAAYAGRYDLANDQFAEVRCSPGDVRKGPLQGLDTQAVVALAHHLDDRGPEILGRHGRYNRAMCAALGRDYGAISQNWRDYGAISSGEAV
jgi:hypothetical protein